MTNLILIRGLPGSGKSTLAKMICGDRNNFVHVEADMYFTINGQYIFDPSLLPKAHERCLNITTGLLVKGNTVVVSNTFTRNWEMQPYKDMCKNLNMEYSVLTCEGNFGNVHNVPEEVINRMRERWEPNHD